MKRFRLGLRPMAIVGGIGLLTTATVGYWQLNQPPDCVRLTTGGGQEVTYSRGCINPQRYKRWVTTT